mmetsp:Transcript_4754/g.17827  ORF Transcript_4754/g.17827 Transcript_4754/m.17827 type:complete len:82 (+) Transcript_4754:2636-2881(+)
MPQILINVNECHATLYIISKFSPVRGKVVELHSQSINRDSGGREYANNAPLFQTTNDTAYLNHNTSVTCITATNPNAINPP